MKKNLHWVYLQNEQISKTNSVFATVEDNPTP
jgi:hypothetical protein